MQNDFNKFLINLSDIHATRSDEVFAILMSVRHQRKAVFLQVADSSDLQLSICPQKGLHTQHYRCAECRVQIGLRTFFHHYYHYHCRRHRHQR